MADEPAPDRFRWVEVAREAELRAWLHDHHGHDDAVWLVTWKRVVTDRYVSTAQVLDQPVAFGWCDGIRRRVDDARTRQLIRPRRTQPWATSYQDRAERLIAAGTTAPAGLAAVERARATGMWEAMADVDALQVPSDLAGALAARRGAAEHFAGFPPSTRRNVLCWIASMRTPPTRDRRITLTADQAQHGIRVKSIGGGRRQG